jgi:hypothetical protein
VPLDGRKRSSGTLCVAVGARPACRGREGIPRQRGYAGAQSTVTLSLGRMEVGDITGPHTLSVYRTVGTGDAGAAGFARISVIGTA